MPVHKFRFNGFECGFGHGIVIRTSLKAKGSGDAKSIKNFINQVVVELASPVGVEQLNFIQGGGNRCEGIQNQLSIFVRTCAVANDFTVKKVQ